MFKTNDVCEFRIAPRDEPLVGVIKKVLVRGGFETTHDITLLPTATMDGYDTIALEHQLTKIGTMVFISNKDHLKLGTGRNADQPGREEAIQLIIDQCEGVITAAEASA